MPQQESPHPSQKVFRGLIWHTSTLTNVQLTLARTDFLNNILCLFVQGRRLMLVGKTRKGRDLFRRQGKDGTFTHESIFVGSGPDSDSSDEWSLDEDNIPNDPPAQRAHAPQRSDQDRHVPLPNDQTTQRVHTSQPDECL